MLVSNVNKMEGKPSAIIYFKTRLYFCIKSRMCLLGRGSRNRTHDEGFGDLSYTI